MTREEAIRWLEIEKSIIEEVPEQPQGARELTEAYDIAIEALRQKGAYEQTKWERDVALQTLEEHGIGLGQKAEHIIPSGGVIFTSADCSTCKHKDKDWDSQECDSCCGNNNHYTLAEAEEVVLHKILEKGMIEIPSVVAESDDLIIKGAKGIKDGLYNIKDGKLFQYKAKGGAVRTYPIIKGGDDE